MHSNTLGEGRCHRDNTEPRAAGNGPRATFHQCEDTSQQPGVRIGQLNERGTGRAQTALIPMPRELPQEAT